MYLAFIALCASINLTFSQHHHHQDLGASQRNPGLQGQGWQARLNSMYLGTTSCPFSYLFSFFAIPGLEVRGRRLASWDEGHALWPQGLGGALLYRITSGNGLS